MDTTMNIMQDFILPISENIPKIYEKGRTDGRKEGYNDGYTDGYNVGKAESVEPGVVYFNNEYQDNGNRTDYSNAYAGAGWPEHLFRPQHDMVPTNAYMMFRGNPLNVDLVEYLENLNIKLDFSKSTNTQYLFNASNFTRIGVIDFRGSTNSTPGDGAFANNRNLVTIDKIYIKTGSSAEFNSSFNNCVALENIVLEGTITKNGFNVQHSTKLSKATLINIVNVLSTTTSGTSITVSKAAVNKAFETAEGANDGSTSSEWTTLIATRSNWTINLV